MAEKRSRLRKGTKAKIRKVVQELLRHASMKVTTDVYMQAVSTRSARRRASW